MENMKQFCRILGITICLIMPISSISAYAIDESTQGSTEKKSPPPSGTEGSNGSGEIITPEMRMLIYLIGVLVP